MRSSPWRSTKAGAKGFNLLLGLLTEEGGPAGSGAASSGGELHDGVAVAEGVGSGPPLGLGQDFHAEAGLVVDVGLVSGGHVVVIEAVFDQQLPVGLDAVAVAALHDPHSRLRLVDNEVDELGGSGEVAAQVHGVGVVADEDEAAVGVDMGRGEEAEVGLVEPLGVACLVGDADEFTTTVEGPSVVEALEYLAVALVVAADEGAAVAAGVVEDAYLAVAGADEEEGASAHLATAVVAGVGDLGLVTEVEPAAVEEALAFQLQDLGRCHGGAVNAKDVAFDVVNDEWLGCHGGPPKDRPVRATAVRRIIGRGAGRLKCHVFRAVRDVTMSQGFIAENVFL